MCSSVAPGQEGMSAEIKICSRRLFSWFLVDKVSKCKQYFDTSQTDTGIIRSMSGKTCIVRLKKMVLCQHVLALCKKKAHRCSVGDAVSLFLDVNDSGEYNKV